MLRQTNQRKRETGLGSWYKKDFIQALSSNISSKNDDLYPFTELESQSTNRSFGINH